MIPGQRALHHVPRACRRTGGRSWLQELSVRRPCCEPAARGAARRKQGDRTRAALPHAAQVVDDPPCVAVLSALYGPRPRSKGREPLVLEGVILVVGVDSSRSAWPLGHRRGPWSLEWPHRAAHRDQASHTFATASGAPYAWQSLQDYSLLLWSAAQPSQSPASQSRLRDTKMSEACDRAILIAPSWPLPIICARHVASLHARRRLAERSACSRRADP